MNTEFLHRIKREILVSVEGARETILTVSDRVNRKGQVFKLHWRAARIAQDIAQAQQELGAFLVEAHGHPAGSGFAFPIPGQPSTQAKLEEIAGRLRLLKQELAQVDHLVGEIENETLLEDFLRLQRDLAFRGAAIRRVTVAPGAAATGRQVDQLDLSASTRVVAVFRGPALLAPQGWGPLRPGDIVLLLGMRSDLQKDLPQFTERQRATA